VQDTAEQSTTLVVSTQKGVDVAFSTAERTMQMDDYSERVLAPMINNLAGDVAVTIMRGVEGGVSNYVSNVDGAGAIASPTSRTVLESGALLTKRSAPSAAAAWSPTRSPWPTWSRPCRGSSTRRPRSPSSTTRPRSTTP
jgi:hypothetical protein